MKIIFNKPTASILVSLSLSLWVGSAGLAIAQDDWPQKPVKVVVPYAPGGSADLLGRTIANYLSKSLKQPFVIDNRAGAGGSIGSQAVAKSQPDGFNLLVSGIGSHVIAPAFGTVNFHPLKDFTHIASLGGPPTVLVVNAGVPVRDLKGLLTYVVSQKDGLSWGSPGQGTHGHLIGELFSVTTKLNMVHISYKGAAPAMVDLVGGQIQASFVTLSSANAHIKSGKIRALAITSSGRLKDFPDVPTFAELGYPQLTATTWFSISGPAGMSPEITTKLNTEIRKGLKSRDVQQVYALEGIETQDLDAEKFGAFFKAETLKWAPLIQSLKTSK